MNHANLVARVVEVNRYPGGRYIEAIDATTGEVVREAWGRVDDVYLGVPYRLDFITDNCRIIGAKVDWR